MNNYLRMGLIIVTFNCFLGFAWIDSHTELIRAIEAGSNVEMDIVAPMTFPLASFERAIFWIYMVCLPGLLVGKRIAKVIFLTVLFLMMLEAIVGEGAWIIIEFSQLLSQFKRSPIEVIWGGAYGVLWIFWFAFNYWFFMLKVGGKQLLTFPISK